VVPRAAAELAAPQTEAERVKGEQGSSLPERAVAAAMLALARASQWHLLSAAAGQSPSVAMLTELQDLLHAEAATVPTDLARPGGDKLDPELIARARDHMAQVPAEMLDQLLPVVRDVFLLRRIVADDTPTGTRGGRTASTLWRSVRDERCGPSRS
jgi:hypothetical protein